MEKIVPQLYADYGKYVNTQKMVPSIIDGLLPVHKRLLLGAHKICRTKYRKTAEVVGGVMANWHPHSLDEKAFEWAVTNGFMDGWGNWGTVYGATPEGCAAMRYTKLKANEFVEDIAFKYVDFVDWKEAELEPEPVAIPTMIPFCLFSRFETIRMAFGFKTEIPTYNIEDLIKRLIWVLNGKKGRPTIPIPYIEGCIVDDNKKEFKKLLTKGQARFDVEGIYEEDPDNFSVIIKGWSPRTTFTTILKKINNYKEWELLDNEDVGFRDASTGKDGTTCIFEVIKKRNRLEIYDKLVEAIKETLKSRVSYKIYVVALDGTPKQVGVDDMLIAAYNFHKEAFNKYLNHNIEKLKEKIKEVNIIGDIKPHISSIKLDDVDKVCKDLAKKTKHNFKDVKSIIEKYAIKRLITVDTDVKFLEDKLKAFQLDLKNIDSVIQNNYEAIVK